VTTHRHRPRDVDRHVGARVRALRGIAGLSQQAIAALIGVTYQQAHKYETGVNRLAASRLYALAVVDQRHIVDLARLYRRIAEPAHKRSLRLMAAALAGNGAAEAVLAGGD
jgi:transcriptional regulator with XRE-family HTH domain